MMVDERAYFSNEPPADRPGLAWLSRHLDLKAFVQGEIEVPSPMKKFLVSGFPGSHDAFPWDDYRFTPKTRVSPSQGLGFRV